MDAAFSISASLRPADVAGAAQQDAGLRDGVHALSIDLGRIGLLSRRRLDLLQRALEQPIARPLAAAAILAVAAGISGRAGGLFRRRRHFSCQVRSLSEVILERDVSRIAVLKIDVEGSGWDVLAGVDSEPRIRQLVVDGGFLVRTWRK